MGLEIQGAVNSMIGSVGSVIRQNEENKRKALNIALGAVTGGAGGAISAAAKEAGINHQAVDQVTGFQAQQDQKEDEQAVARSMNRRQLEANAYSNQINQQLSSSQAAQRAGEHMRNAQDEKRQRNQFPAGSFMDRMTKITGGK